MEQRALLTIDLDLASLATETANGKKQVAGLVAELKKLKDEGQENTAEYAQLEAQLKNVRAEVRQNATTLAQMEKAQKSSTGSINDMRTSLSLMTKQYNSLSKEERENVEIGVKLRNNMKATSDELKDLEKNVGNTSRNVGNYKESILEALEAQLPFVGSLRQGAGSFNTMATNGGQAVGMLGKLKYALAATGVGLIVVAFGLLINYLRTLSPVMDKLAQIGAGVGEVFKTLGGTVARLGNIFTDFSGSMRSLANFMTNPIKAMKEYGSELGNAAKEAANLTKAQQDLEDAMADQAIKTARTQARVAQLVLQARNRTLDNSERQRLLAEAEKLDEQDFLARSKHAEQQYNVIVNEIKNRGRLTQEEFRLLARRGAAYARELEDEGKAEADAVERLQEAELARIEIQRESTNRQEKIQNQADALAEKAEAAAEKREEKRKAAAEKAAAVREKELEKERALAEKRAELALQDSDILGGLASERSKQLLDKAQKEAIQSLNENFNIRKRALIEQGIETAELERQHQRDLQEIEYQYTIIRTNDNRELELEQARQKYRDLKAEREKVGADTTAIIEAQRVAEIEINAKYDAIEYDNQLRRNEQDYQFELERFRQQEAIQTEIANMEERIADRRSAIANGFLNVIQDNFKKHTALSKTAFLIQKAIAIADIITQTRRQVALNRTATQAKALAADAILPGSGTIIRAKGAIENAQIIVTAGLDVAAVAATILPAFKKGGVFESDGKGNLVKGSGTSTSDSINARLSNGEAVMTAKSVQMFKPLLSYLNQLGGGRSFDKPSASGTFATGGMFQDTLGVYNSNRVQDSFNYAELSSQMAKSIQPVLIIEEVEYKMQDRDYIKTVQNQ